MKIERKSSYAQDFSPFSKQYFLNANNELEELPTLRNDQEAIDSCLDSSLDAILDKFLNGELTPPVNKFLFTEECDEYVANRMCVDDLVDAERIFTEAASELGIDYTDKKSVIEAYKKRTAESLAKLSAQKDEVKKDETPAVVQSE